jgi:hypothetical protein
MKCAVPRPDWGIPDEKLGSRGWDGIANEKSIAGRMEHLWEFNHPAILILGVAQGARSTDSVHKMTKCRLNA